MSRVKYKYGDVRYYWGLHIQRMQEIGEQPVNYSAFYNRLRKGMVLKEAIYTSKTAMAKNRIKIPKPKPIRNWWYRFISLFK